MIKRQGRLVFAAITALLLVVAGAAATLAADAPARHQHYPGPVTAAVDLAALDQVVGDARVVVFGEDSHFMAAIHNAVPQMFEHLAEKKHFRVFVFEAQWGLQEAFRDFMASDRTVLTPRESFFLDGAFESPDIIKMLVWIREFNRAHPADPILITGFQPEQPVTDFRDLWAYVAKAAPRDLTALRASTALCRAGDAKYLTDSDFIGEAGKRVRSGKPSYTDEERAGCLAALDRLDAYLDGHRTALVARAPEGEREVARLHIHSLATYVGNLTVFMDHSHLLPDAPLAEKVQWEHDAYQAGDARRFEIFNKLRDVKYGDRKVFFWMHDWHAARHASELQLLDPHTVGIPRGTVSVGERLAGEYGPKLVTIGTFVPCDAACTEPPNSLEPAFARLFGDKTAILDLHHPSAAERGLPLHTPGQFLANYHKEGFSNFVVDRQFDALFYVPATGSTN